MSLGLAFSVITMLSLYNNVNVDINNIKTEKIVKQKDFTSTNKTVDKQKEKHYNEMEYKGKFFKFSENTLSLDLDPAETDMVQAYIDKGLIAQQGNVAALDNKSTVLSGHNPGIMSYFSQNVKKGDLVSLYTKEGVKLTYKLERYFVTPIQQSGANFLVTELDNEFVKNLHTQENLYIQYCIEPNMYIWKAVFVGKENEQNE